MRRIIVLAVLSTLAVSCGMKMNDASSGKTIIVKKDQGYSEEFEMSEEQYIAKARLMAALLAHTVKTNANVKEVYDHVVALGIVPGREIRSDYVNRVCQSEQEMGEPGQTIYSFNFTVSARGKDAFSLLDEGDNSYETEDGTRVFTYQIKVLYENDPIENGKLRDGAPKVLQVVLKRGHASPC